MSAGTIELPVSLVERLVEVLERLANPPAKTGLAQKRVMTCQEVATMLGLPVSTVRKWAKDRKLPALQKKGKHWGFDRARIEAMVTGEEVELTRRPGKAAR